MLKKNIKKITLSDGLHEIRPNDFIDTCNIVVTCPNCKINGKISFPTNIIKESKTIAGILVNKKFCEHMFILYLDKDFNVRGCEKILHQAE